MEESEPLAGWADVDETGNAEAFRSYLDAVSENDQFGAVKRGSYRRLSPGPGDRLLDVGCGTGDDVRALAEGVAPGGAVVGVDASGEMVATAEERAGDRDDVEFGVADATALPFRDAAFDGARTDRVLQHLDRPRRSVGELARVVDAGGAVVVTEPDWATMTVDVPAGAADEGERIGGAEWACAETPRVGRRLYRLLVDAGLARVELDATTVAFTEFETAEAVLGLTGRVRRGREAGAISHAEGDRWLDALRGMDAAGTFSATLTMFTAAGRKPGSSARN